jgi:hypothetical protein
MSEYELADYTNSLMNTFLTTFTMFMSIVTAYVVTAFAAGNRLTQFQFAVVNVIYLIATGVIGLLAIIVFRRFFAHAIIVATPVGDGVETAVDFTIPIGLIFISMVVGSLMFMWSVRNPKSR